jgi:hypothetical protein
MGRLTILVKITEDPIASPLVELFRPLLTKWRDISRGAAREVSTLLKSPTSPDNDTLRNTTFNYFGKYLEEGFSHLSNLPASWKEHFPGMFIPCPRNGDFFSWTVSCLDEA